MSEPGLTVTGTGRTGHHLWMCTGKSSGRCRRAPETSIAKRRPCASVSSIQVEPPSESAYASVMRIGLRISGVRPPMTKPTPKKATTITAAMIDIFLCILFETAAPGSCPLLESACGRTASSAPGAWRRAERPQQRVAATRSIPALRHGRPRSWGRPLPCCSSPTCLLRRSRSAGTPPSVQLDL